MMKQAKNLTQTIADNAGDFAKRAADAAEGAAKAVASAASDAANSAADAASELAKAIGPKRGLIGLGVIAAAVGGTVVARRFLRGRGEAVANELDGGLPAPKKTRKNVKRSAAPVHAH